MKYYYSQHFRWKNFPLSFIHSFPSICFLDFVYLGSRHFEFPSTFSRVEVVVEGRLFGAAFPEESFCT